MHIVMLGGKAQKKGMEKWKNCYAVLTEQLFMIFRNSKDFMSHKVPDEFFDTKQAKIRWSDMERSKKDNVFEVYDEKTLILFYHEEFNEANLWMRNFMDIENKHKENHNFTKEDLEKEDKESKVEGLNRFFARWCLIFWKIYNFKTSIDLLEDQAGKRWRRKDWLNPILSSKWV